ncbi:hypothetical protein [Marinobacter sp. JSM 1782161]|uniref:hypothetical protein n=1 Tax=Marinobacter sp. JSM 1782161 TaxID=2685906 RepID=UPI001D18A5FB|nr:hypothetical protein [Marinobacter sp. JSM 1782161]
MGDAAKDLDRIVIDPESLDWWPHKEFCKLYNKGEQWAWGKIKEGKWIEGEQYVYDPDGQIWVSIVGFKKWLLSSSQQGSVRMVKASKSDLAGTESDTNRSGKESRRKRTSRRPVVFDLK